MEVGSSIYVKGNGGSCTIKEALIHPPFDVATLKVVFGGLIGS